VGGRRSFPTSLVDVPAGLRGEEVRITVSLAQVRKVVDG
jgi:hypothetical protein